MRFYNEWGRKPPIDALERSPKARRGVFVHHTVTRVTETKLAAEWAHMRQLQEIAFSRGFSDISYNHVLFPQTGHIYKGRGFMVVGAHNDGMNTDFLGIAVVGNFQEDKFPDKAKIALVEYIRHAEDKGYLPEHPIVAGHRDTDATSCPGVNVYNSLSEIRRLVGGREL